MDHRNDPIAAFWMLASLEARLARNQRMP